MNRHWKESQNEKLYFMKTIHEQSPVATANPAIKPVNFFCSAPWAKAVRLSGDFNHWHPILMERKDDGWWFIRMWLPHGRHLYRFLVDDVPMLDKHAASTDRDLHNQPASLVAVG